VSLWVEILLDKYAFIRPTQRLLSDLRSHDIDLSLGTVTGGLKQLAPVFKPIREEIIRMNLEQLVWHADETRWPVFVPVEGKVGWQFERREQELSDLELHPVRRKLLVSLGNHWNGLTLFIDHPEIPMDNNTAERTLRLLVCGRKQFFGSRAVWAGHLAANLFSLFATLQLWAINPRKWLSAYLHACAQAGGQAPPDAARWLPWNLPLPERTAMAELPEVDDTS